MTSSLDSDDEQRAEVSKPEKGSRKNPPRGAPQDVADDNGAELRAPEAVKSPGKTPKPPDREEEEANAKNNAPSGPKEPAGEILSPSAERRTQGEGLEQAERREEPEPQFPETETTGREIRTLDEDAAGSEEILRRKRKDRPALHRLRSRQAT